ncbi:ribosome biogenesis protein bop1-like [Gigantopelta aegis]|uniref:ribosome biogenesis protein bop1-like n=1 Tax=Gigantopelta aegis TaxID=1735272 RepID=UPI001B888428|nr:ribosome biogenesis protein bop1-like [Gigantopelta aegis]
MSAVKRKSLTDKQFTSHADADNLFAEKVPNSESDDEEESDSSDSSESEYSGLEEEPDTSDDEDSDSKMPSDSDSSGNESSESDTATYSLKQTDSKTGSAKQKKGLKTEANTNEGQTSEEKPDEYEHDSSDEEDVRNTVGNIPLEWYREFAHIGYDVEGRKLIKPAQGDELDEFLNKVDDPNYWRTVTNKMTGQKVLLSASDVKMIQNVQKGKSPAGSQSMYEPWIDFFSYDTMLHPVTNRPADKRSFIPSKWERLKVGQMVHAIKMGWMKPPKEKKEGEQEDKEEEITYYDLWKDDNESEITRRYRQHIPAPKLPLPGHEESYNPPPEYLLTEEEEDKYWDIDPEDRRMNFIPRKYSSLRLVPAYDKFVNERFARCLDLYLCPRQRIMRMHVNPEDLIPKLPKPRDLQPFPTIESLVYKGHSDMVRCLSVEHSGQWLASGSDDETIRLWEVATGRCLKTIHMDGKVKSLAWNPSSAVCLLAAVVDNSVLILNPGLGDKLVITNTDDLVSSFEAPEESTSEKKLPVQWETFSEEKYEVGFRIKISHPKEVSQVTWHIKGDYLATVMPKGDSMSVLIHQFSKRRSQNPFRKSKGLVQCVLFHPVRPYLLVATQRYVRIYNLLKQELTKKLFTNCKWVSSLAIHPGGDNVIIGSYDSRLSWFDLDLSTKPYQTLKHHKKALRQVTYHKRYPLFASASDDGSVIVCHGMVYSDLLQNPLIVPVKVLKGHVTTNGLGVLDCQFHPSQPWIFSSGADGLIRLYT